TAGRGIVHSERSPENQRGHERSLSGLQTWLALPDAMEEIDPVFAHTEERMLPHLADGGVRARVVIGQFEGAASPVSTFTDTIYVDLMIEPGKSAPFAANWEERALYILSGEAIIAGDHFDNNQLLVFRPGDEITITAGPAGCHVMLFGGAALGSPRHIWWNFVSSSKERIDKAKEEWRTGRFDIVPGDEEEFIPLPAS
ncbi:pirin family protein, partial [Sinorhizobium meliloti]